MSLVAETKSTEFHTKTYFSDNKDLHRVFFVRSKHDFYVFTIKIFFLLLISLIVSKII